jgi:HSP20 family protein
MIEHMFSSGGCLFEEPWFPVAAALDLEEKAEEYRVRVELKDFDPTEINVEVTDQSLLIRARHDVPPDDKSGDESSVMARQVDLPSSIDIGKVTATFKLGTLEVVLPRKECVLPRQVPVLT